MTTSTRDRILDALKDLLVADGSGAMTLDAVAAAAGVSKGGLLYHFPSKAALVTGLAQRLRAYTEANVAEAREKGVVRTFLQTSLPDSEEAEHYWAVLLAIRGTKGEVFEEAASIFRDVFELWSVLLGDEVGDPVLAATIRLVGDGLYLEGVTGLSQPGPREVEQVIEHLIEKAAASAPRRNR